MRATTAFNKMLAVPGADVVGVTFTPEGIVVDVRRRARAERVNELLVDFLAPDSGSHHTAV